MLTGCRTANPGTFRELGLVFPSFINEGDLYELLLFREDRAELEESSSVEWRALARRRRILRCFLAFYLDDIATVGATFYSVLELDMSGGGTWSGVLWTIDGWVQRRC